MIDHWICTLFVKSMLLSIEIVHLTLNNSIRICLVLVSVFSAVYITIFTLLLSRWNWFNKADYTAWVVSCVTSSLLYCTATSHSELQLLNFALSDSFIRHCACVRVFVCSCVPPLSLVVMVKATTRYSFMIEYWSDWKHFPHYSEATEILKLAYFCTFKGFLVWIWRNRNVFYRQSCN